MRSGPTSAISLSNQAGQLADLERADEAMAAIEEATGIYRELAATWPGVYLPDLAEALLYKSVILADLGRHEDSEANGKEAVVYYRRLADNAIASQYAQGFTSALENLAAEQASLGREDEAQRTRDEAATW